MTETNCATGVYCITNKVNGKRYIGSSSRSIKGRVKQHKIDLRLDKHHSSHLQGAWNKYGEQSFTFSIIERCSPELCITKEQYWMDKFKSYIDNYGYNISPTAGSCIGCKISEESRRKMSEAAKKRVEKPGEREKLTSISKEYYKDPEARKLASEIAKKRFTDPEQRRKAAEVRKKLWEDPQHREMMSKALKGINKGVPRPAHVIDKMMEGLRKSREQKKLAEIERIRLKCNRSRRCIVKRKQSEPVDTQPSNSSNHTIEEY